MNPLGSYKFNFTANSEIASLISVEWSMSRYFIFWCQFVQPSRSSLGSNRDEQYEYYEESDNADYHDDYKWLLIDEWFEMCKVKINQSKTLAKEHAKSVKHFDEQAK